MAIIPARGGSKGIPGKNIADIAGKPLIAWTIEAALASRIIDRVVVSTDDDKIAEIARNHGAEVPWMRPPELALDTTATVDVLIYNLQRLETEQNYIPDLIMLLQPTSPLRTSDDIVNAVDVYKEKDAKTVVSVCETSDHPYLVKKLDDTGQISTFMDISSGEQNLRRQDLPPAYVLNGAIYLTGRNSLLQQKSLYEKPVFAYIMPAERSIDIDTPLDMELARVILKNMHGNER